MKRTQSRGRSNTEQRARELQAELVRLQVKRNTLTQRLNTSYDTRVRSKGAGRKSQSAGAQLAVHALQVEIDQLDARLAELRQALDQLEAQKIAETDAEIERQGST